MPDALKIEQPRQVLVEGIDDARLFMALTRHMGLQGVQVHQYEGYQNLRNFLRTFVALPNFNTVISLAIVADANSDRNARYQSIVSHLSRANLPAPSAPLQPATDGSITATYLVVPHQTAGTMLEDVCLASVADDPVMECVDQYFECIGAKDVEGPRQVWMPKARVHAFLASRARPDLRMGEAADSGIWPFEDDTFAPMRELLRLL